MHVHKHIRAYLCHYRYTYVYRYMEMHINAFYFVFEYCIFSPYQVVGFWEHIYLRRQETIKVIYIDLRPGKKA